MSLTEVKQSVQYLALSLLNVWTIVWYPASLCHHVTSVCRYLGGLVEVFRPSNCADDSPAVYRLSLALVCIFIAFVTFSCIARGLFLCFECWYRSHHADLDGAGVFPNLAASPEVILALPMFRYSQARVHPEKESDNTCSICLCEFEEDDEVTRLPCKHVFHLEEIREWLKHKGTCPLCLAEVTLDGIRDEPATSPSNGTQNELSAVASETSPST